MCLYNVQQNKWISNSQIDNSAKFPSPRTDHSIIKYQNNFFVYGGRDETHIFADVFLYSTSEN